MQFDYDAYIQEPLPFNTSISRYFKKKDKLVIFEVGSCEGEDTIRLKKRFPNAVVHTFEPVPENLKKIETNFKRYHIELDKIHKVALSDANGSAKFHVSSGQPEEIPENNNWDFGNKSSSLLPPKEHTKTLPWIKFDKKITVRTQRLDDFCKEKSIDTVDFIYMDVQGAELMVLEGAGKYLNNVGAIWMEVEAVELYDSQPLKDDVENFMKNHGFVKVMDTVDAISGDQLYINKKLHAKKGNKIKRILGFNK